MPFDEEPDDLNEEVKKPLLKNFGQKSMFDNTVPKKSNQEILDKKAKIIHDKSNLYKKRAAELMRDFNKIMQDKTLPENKNVFGKNFEIEILSNLIKFAEELNNDPDENEGYGSLSIITMLLKNSFQQRDNINVLEYEIFKIQNKMNSVQIVEQSPALDKTPKSG